MSGKSLLFFAVMVLLICRSFRQQLKDNQPWRRYGSIALGLIFITWGLVSIGLGRITAWRDNPQTYHVSNDPLGFWLTVSCIIVIGIGCVIRGIMGRK